MEDKNLCVTFFRKEFFFDGKPVMCCKDEVNIMVCGAAEACDVNVIQDGHHLGFYSKLGIKAPVKRSKIFVQIRVRGTCFTV